MLHNDGVDGVDPAELKRWMDEHGIGCGPLRGLRGLGGGTQNVVVEFGRGASWYVLRRPPVSGRPDGSATILREASVLTGLRGSDVPHPPLIASCADEAVLGAAFYLMEPVPGANPASDPPRHFVSHERWQRELGFAMIDTLVKLRRVDVSTQPLSSLGSTDGWTERQASRWMRRLGAVRDVPGYEQLPAAGLEKIADWLDAHRPDTVLAGLVHGDFQFANVLVDEEEPRVTAVVDWELASLGDPRLDLAHFVTTLQMGPVPGLFDLRRAPGVPTVAELVQRYLDATGDACAADIAWFRVLACLRLIAILEETVGRAASGHASQRLAETFRAVTLDLLELAQQMIAESERDTHDVQL